MGFKIQSIDEAVGDNGLKILVHGLAGSGKTVLCATSGKPTIILSAEAGLLSIKGAVENGLLPESVMKLVKVIQISNLDDLQEAYEMFKDDHICDWIALDSISEIAEVVLEYEKSQSKDARQAYGNLSTVVNDLLRKFRDLPKYNVIMSCKQQRLVDQDTDRVTYGPSMPGAKLGGAIPYLFDEVFALRVEKDDDGEDYRTLQTSRDLKYEAKDRSGKLSMFEPPSLHSIVAKIKGNSEKPVAASVMEVEDVQSNDGKDVSDTDRFFYHAESDSCWGLYAGDEMPKDADSQISVEITEEEYNQRMSESKIFDNIESKIDKDESNLVGEYISDISEKDMYWLHKPTGKLAATVAGDDISDFIENEEVEEITKLKYTKLKKD